MPDSPAVESPAIEKPGILPPVPDPDVDLLAHGHAAHVHDSTAGSPSSGSGRVRRRLEHPLLGLLPLVAVCLISLWYPSDSDQALFQVGARQLSGGAVFYRDFWDIKQPGIYWFHQLGTALGLGGLGARLLEPALVMAAGVLLLYLVREWGLRLSVRAAAPTLVLAPYVLLTDFDGLGQVEGLLVPLLVMIAAAAWPAGPAAPAPSRRRAFAAGLLIGVVGVLKLLYLPVAALLLLPALLAVRDEAWPQRWRRRSGFLLVTGLGAAVPLLATTGYFVAHHVVTLAWITTVALPTQVSALPGTHPSAAYGYFFSTALALLAACGPLAAVSLVTARRRGWPVREATLAGCAVLAALLSLPQFPAAYRPLMLAAPLGLLAVTGLEVTLAWLDARPRHRGGWRLAAALLALALALPLLRGPARLLHRAPEVGSWSLADSARLQRDAVLTDSPAGDEAALVAARVRPGDPIYVLGDPTIYLWLQARQAVETVGWWPQMPDAVWRELTRELVRSRPRLVYLQDSFVAETDRQGPGIRRLLAQDYRPLAHGSAGTWYLTDHPGPSAPTRDGNRLTT